MKRLALVFFALLAASVASADGPAKTAAPPPPPDVHAARASSPIQLDGLLNDAAWSAAEPCSAFFQREPDQGSPARQRTEVRVLYDDDALYVGARLYDTQPDSILRQLTRRDQGGTRSDGFGVLLDPYYDRRSGYYFRVSAAGTLYDGTLYNDGWDDDSWDGVWEGRAHVDEGGWTAEMRIPFSQLRFARAAVQKWGINFNRQMGREFEDDYLVYTPRGESGYVSRFPALLGLADVTPGSAIELTPYATSKAEFIHYAPLDPLHDGTKVSPNVGGDLRMALGNRLTLNATVNPDFGQVEVDPAVVNLSDVETFFPEKRPFFVEGSSIFSAGQQGASDYWGFNYPMPTFFYSRRIGRAPAGSTPDNTAYADVPNGTTILGAAKVSGKIVDGLNFGTLHAVTSREQADIQFGDASRGRADVEPLTYYSVTRALKEFGGRRTGLGALATTTVRRFDDARLEDEFNRGAFTGVVDGWRFIDPKRTWVASGFVAGTYVDGTAARIASLQRSSRHYYQRPDASSYSYDPTATSLAGSAARVWLNKEKGNWFSNSALGYISPGFEVSDLGFQSRTDVINSHVGAGYRWTTPTKHVKSHNALAAVFASRDFDGDLTNAGVWGKMFWWYHNNWTLELRSAYNPETVNPRRSRGGPRMLNAPGYENSFFFDTDGSRNRYYYVSAYSYSQPDEDSYNWNVEPNFTYKPMSNVSISLTPNYEQARDGAYPYASFADAGATSTYGTRWLFSRLDQTTLSTNIRLNIAFTPRMSLQFYGQPYVTSGRFTDVRALVRPKSLDLGAPGTAGAGDWTYDASTGAVDPDGAGPADAFVPQQDFNYKSLRGNAVFRWEYTPGAAVYFVWTQTREGEDAVGDFEFSRSMHRLGRIRPDNIFLVKATYYLSR